MKRWSRYTTFAMTLLMVLALSAMQVVPVLADDGAPPPTETPEVVPPPTENAEPEAAPTEPPATDVTEVAPEATPVATEVPADAVPVVAQQAPAEEQAPAPSAAEAPAAEPETPAEVLAQVPAGTEIVVLDKNGKALPLASAEAAEVLYSGDPIWCPVGVTPNSGAGGCSLSYNTLNELVAAFTPTTNGVIWIQNTGDVMSAAVTLGTGVGASWGSAINYSLTLKGGWNGTLGSSVIDPLAPSTLDSQLTISGWNADITLSDIVITGAGGAGYALEVGTTKNITLTNVDVQDNATTHGGAYLNNVGGTGNVTINDSTFNGNLGATSTNTDRTAGGLVLRSSGNVTIKNLTAYGNGGAGVNINNTTTLTAKTVTLTGSNNFNDNEGDGLVVLSRGAITLSNINAMTNGGQGAYLDNCNYNSGTDECTQTIPSAVTLKGSANLSGNGSDGLVVYSGGIITAANLTANDNGSVTENGYGAYLNNYGAILAAKTITLTGVNTFNNNTGAGLWLDSWGLTTLNNLTANENGGGINCTTDCDGVHVENAASIMLLGYGNFNGNKDYGLNAGSWGIITLNNLYATLNGWGVRILGSNAAISLLGTNVFNSNINEGLSINSNGPVILNNVTANNNDGDGVYVNNAWKWVYNPTISDWVQVSAGQAVTLNGVSTFNGNGGTGLTVISSGVITTNGITASGNDGWGAYLDNCLYDDTVGIDDCTVLPGKAVTMNGNNTLSENLGNGLYIESLGAVKVNNLTANYNGGIGAYLDNNWTKAIGGVTITGFSTTSGNYGAGLNIFSVGAVTTSNLTANGNGPATSAAADEVFYRGVYIYNAGNPTKAMTVTLNGVNTFNNNWNTGLRILSTGNVILNNITANGNGMLYDATNNPTPEGYGVFVRNSTASAPRTVTLNGVNVFNENFNDGLNILSRGAVSVSKPTANVNGSGGVSINNQFNVAAAPVTILGYGIFNTNTEGAGLSILSNGLITLNNITANENGGDGVNLVNNRMTVPATAAPVNVTLLGVNTFNNNGGDGLSVTTDGMITLNNITANYNTGDGVNLDNATHMKALNPRTVVLNGWGTFVGNVGTGLEILASGAVSLTRITANNNGAGGVFVDSDGAVTLTCGSLTNNTGTGYTLSGTVITLKGVFTYANTVANTATPAAIITRTCPLP